MHPDFAEIHILRRSPPGFAERVRRRGVGKLEDALKLHLDPQ